MRLDVVICDECGETYRLASGEPPSRHVLASLLVGQSGEQCYLDDLGLIEAGWRVRDGRHWCPDHFPTDVLEPIR